MNGSEPKPRTRRWRAVWIVLAMLIAIVGSFAWTFFVDIAPIDDSDLRITLPTGKDTVGARIIYACDGVSAHELLSSEWKLDELPITASFPPESAAHRRAHTLRITALSRALDESTFAPEDWNRFNWSLRDLDALIRLSAIDALAAGDLRGAARFLDTWDHLEACGYAGGHPGFPWLETPYTWLPLIEAAPSVELLREWLGRFDPSPEPVARRILRARWGYEMIARSLDRESALFGSGLHFRPERTRALIAEAFREKIAAIERGEDVGPSLFEAAPSAWVAFVTGNMHGVEGIRFADEGGGFDRYLLEDFPIEDVFAVTLIGLRLHFLERGEWPEQLDALAPDFIPALPTDPFDRAGGPLRWDRERRLLWSVGLDEVDDGAPQVTLEWARGKDFVWEVSE